MKKKIFIRVDGNSIYGLGHLIRCIALANMLNPYFKIYIVHKAIPPFYIEKFSNIINFIRIEKEEQFFKLLENKSMVIIDGYHFTANYYEQLRKYAYKIISIQDVNHYVDNIDLVINHLPNMEKRYFKVDHLCGPKYAIVRKEFLTREISNTKNLNNYFISLGGTPNSHIVSKILKWINEYNNKIHIDVLTTKENSNLIEGSNLSLHTDKSAKEIVDLIDISSVCFITPGMIAYEVLSRKKLAIVGALNDGQHYLGTNFGHIGFIEYVGIWTEMEDQKLESAMNFANVKKKKIEEIFDGRSGERIAKKILEIC